MKTCQRFLVSGLVQGVWFRGSTRDKALSLGLTGYACNMPDGRVEVLACGDNDKLGELQCKAGSGKAHPRPKSKTSRIPMQNSGK
jgi:acylphosphatase